MGQIKLSKRIDAPRERVFEILADLEGAAGRIEAITKMEILTDGPVGVGTRWRETRTVMKRAATEEMEIVAFDPPSGYDVRCESCGCTYVYQWRCTPDGEATDLDLLMRWKANTLMAKLMTPLGWLMSGMMKKCIQKDLDEIQAAAEAKVEA